MVPNQYLTIHIDRLVQERSNSSCDVWNIPQPLKICLARSNKIKWKQNLPVYFETSALTDIKFLFGLCILANIYRL